MDLVQHCKHKIINLTKTLVRDKVFGRQKYKKKKKRKNKDNRPKHNKIKN